MVHIDILKLNLDYEWQSLAFGRVKLSQYDTEVILRAERPKTIHRRWRMNKISSILPSSSRVTAVDMQDAHPIRPGTPSFGRPVGVSHGRDHISRSSIDAQLMNESLSMRQRGDLEKAKLVQDISAGFFMKRPAIEPSPAATFEVSSPDFIKSAEQYDEVFENYEAFPGLEDTAPAMEPEYLAPGSYIDVKV